MDARSGAPNLFSGAATRTGHPPRWRLPVGGWMERVTGIEPAFSAWEADVLPLNYTRGPGAGFAPEGDGIGRSHTSGSDAVRRSRPERRDARAGSVLRARGGHRWTSS